MSQHDRHTDVNGSAPASQPAAAQPPAENAAPARNGRSVVEQQINENLRRIYQQKLEEDVPEHLSVLLQRLKEQDRVK